jgi:uncharacterized repeat protein (TIGR02543 family)
MPSLRLTHRLGLAVAITGAIALSSLATFDTLTPGVAIAAAGDGVTAYISPPFVQGPPSNTNAIIQDFNTSNFCSTLGVSNVGTFSGDCTSVASGNGDFKFGGANTTSDQPTVGGTATTFAAAWNSQVLSLSFPSNDVRYLGFWWSAGSTGNQVKFYTKVSGVDVLTATFTSNTINSLLNTSGQVEASVLPPNPFPGTQVLTSIDGSQYKKGYYFGRPSDHSSLTPTSMPFNSVNDNIYSHAYLNVYASGSISFSKVEFIGGGFEFDNVAVSNQLRTPSSELVLLQSVLGKSVEFRANGGTGTMPAQTSDAAAQLSSNAFIRTGYTFNGWHTTSSGTGGTPFSDQASFDFANDMVLHAQWTANTLAITYDTQGGSAVNAGSTKTDEAISTDPGTPARDGHTFNGWFSNSAGGNPLTFPHTHGKTAAFTIYAQWTPLPAPTSTTTSSTTTSSTSTSSTSTSSTSTSSTSTSSTTTTVLEPVIAEQQSKDLPVTGTNPWPVASLALLALSFGFVVLHRQRRY